ncbi:MAG: tRNA1(Val) (adenine(37)-N6)-methyltransferase [Cyclobacteriaceae bacterium]
MSKPFQFKQFSVLQDQCAMKIGTDGVLLGAWVNPTIQPMSILDVGAGTGLIGLMMAQRFHMADVDALEIDEAAFEQAVANFEASPWNDRLFCYHAAFQEFVEEMDEAYDLIVSNPPFFPEGQKSPNEQRNVARFSDALPFDYLLKGMSQLLAEDGICALIIPFEQQEEVLNTANEFGLYPLRITHVNGTIEAGIKRSLLELKLIETPSPIITELVIEKARHIYTDDYISLTKDFYLKM